MKLKNKKTGEIVPASNIAVGIGKDGKWYDSLAELNEEWEDYEEPKDYYFIRSESLTVGYSPISNTRSCRNRKEIGNYFDTREEAEKAVEKLKAWKRLKDNCGISFSGLNRDRSGKPVSVNLEFDKKGRATFDEALQNVKDLTLLFGGEE